MGSSSCSYSVLTYTTDVDRGIEVPVGVALWAPGSEFAGVRTLSAGEQLHGVKAPRDHSLIELARENLDAWIAEKALPYPEGEPSAPWSDRWWRHARSLLIHRVRLSEPRAIDVSRPEQELDALYESVVAPYRPKLEGRRRIDGEVARCLGDISQWFSAREVFDGYRARPVRVLRAYRGKERAVIIEGLNLAQDPDANADRLLGKLMRLREGTKNVDLVVGYLPSPHGLNGEAGLVEYLQQNTSARVFDLIRERAQLREEASDLIRRADGQEPLSG